MVSDAGDAIACDPEVRQARMIADAARTRLLACMASSDGVVDLVEAQGMLDALRNARALAEYGVEPRHLRAFRSAADRQSDLIAQIAGPLVKAGKTGARDRADDLAREVAALAITLHTSLIKSAVRDVLHR